jgi:hypothetical protein
VPVGSGINCVVDDALVAVVTPVFQSINPSKTTSPSMSHTSERVTDDKIRTTKTAESSSTSIFLQEKRTNKEFKEKMRIDVDLPMDVVRQIREHTHTQVTQRFD